VSVCINKRTSGSDHCLSLIPLGIETTVVFWPVRLKDSGRVLFFRFELWDCGESAMRRFDHMLPVSISSTYIPLKLQILFHI